MKNLVKSLIISSIFVLSCSNIVLAQGYCPTPDEYTAHLRKYANDAKNLALNNGTPEQAQRLKNEHNQFKKSVYDGCYAYFKTVPKPDCTRVKVLYAGYDDLDASRKPAAKEQLQAMYPYLDNVCSVDAKFYVCI